jgi:hypothetical protein
VRGYEKAGRCSFFNKDDSLLTNDQKGPAHLKILFHCWGKQWAYWGKCPSSYIVKKCPGIFIKRVYINIKEFRIKTILTKSIKTFC